MRFTCNSTCTSLKLLSKVRDDAPSRIQLGDFTRRKPAAAGTAQRPVRPARTAISTLNCSVQRTWRNTFDMYESVAGSPLHHLKLGSSGWTCHVQSYAPRTFFHFAHVASHSIEELFFFSCVRVTFRCVKADNSLAMLLIVFKDGSSTQFCSFEAANIAKLLQVRSSRRAVTRSTLPAHTTAAPCRRSSQQAARGVSNAVLDFPTIGRALHSCLQWFQSQDVGNHMAAVLLRFCRLVHTDRQRAANVACVGLVRNTAAAIAFLSVRQR